jgi:hypothetical protein
MPPVNTENVECVRNVGTQNLNSIEALPSKPKSNVQKSIVWEHFTKVEWGNPEYPKSKCNYCSKLFSYHSRRLGTSSMLSHIRNSYKKYLGRFGKLDRS